VRIVLESGRSARKPRDWSWIDDTRLAHPDDTLGQSVAGLAEDLEAAGYPVTKASVLMVLAQWWHQRIGDCDTGAAQVFATRSVESWQADLRDIPGVNWELADRILLCVGACSVYPLDRGSLRIAVRHGWMDLASDYEDWQAFFTTATRDGVLDLAQLSRWNSAAARDFCQTQPHCEECPLKPLLPARGVVPLVGPE
jgi:endonuclease-3 related protein